MVRIGLMGAGRIGKVHAENVAYRISGAQLLAVTDVVGQAAEACAELYGAEVHPSAEALLADERIDAVLICTSTDTHSGLIEQAAAAGKHIFCEKPIDFELARIDRAIAAVEAAGVKLQIGFNRRFDANALRIRRAVVSGEIGSPHLMHIISRDPAPPPPAYIERSGGLFVDMTIHDFDMARFLMGCEVEEIYAATAVLVDPEIGQLGDVDTALITLKFENGAMGMIDNSRQAVYGYDQRMEVCGSGGNIVSENSFPNRTVVQDAGGVSRDRPLHFFIERYADSFLNEMRAFVSAIASDTAPPVSAIDGRMPVVMGLAAGLSARENRPVRLSDIA